MAGERFPNVFSLRRSILIHRCKYQRLDAGVHPLVICVSEVMMMLESQLRFSQHLAISSVVFGPYVVQAWIRSWSCSRIHTFVACFSCGQLVLDRESGPVLTPKLRGSLKRSHSGEVQEQRLNLRTSPQLSWIVVNGHHWHP